MWPFQTFEGGEVAVVAKAKAQKARIDFLAASAPWASTMDRVAEEKHARVAILQSEHRIILDQLRAGRPATTLAGDPLGSASEVDAAERNHHGIV